MSKEKNRDSRKTASPRDGGPVENPQDKKTGQSARQAPPAKKAQHPRTSRPLNRLRIGTLTLLQLLLFSTTLICVNYLSLNHAKRWDLSRDSEYSLCSATLNYLGSPAIQDREKPVKFIVAYRRTSPLYERVRALAERFASESKGKIELVLVDPMRESDRMEEISATYGISLIRDLILIDARSDDSPVTTEKEERIKVLNPHIKLVTAEHLLVFQTIAEERKISGFRGEEMMTARLVESIEGQPRRMALIADKSRIGRRDASPSRKTLEDLLRFQNITLGEVQISGAESISEEIEGLVIISPQYDFSEDEISMLEDYWNRPRSAMLLLLGDRKVPPRLKAFLRKQGVTPRDDRIIGRSKKSWITKARAFFTEGVPFTDELSRQVTEFGGASSSLEVREGDSDLTNRRISPISLLEVEPGFWGETQFGTGEASYDERRDHDAPLYLAAAVTRGAQSDDRFAADTSRMVVIANTDFLNPAHHRAENLDFLSSSANWLVGRESLAGITPRAISTYKLPLLQAQASFINRCNLIFMPLILLILGTFIWSSRRA